MTVPPHGPDATPQEERRQQNADRPDQSMQSRIRCGCRESEDRFVALTVGQKFVKDGESLVLSQAVQQFRDAGASPDGGST